MNSFDNALHAVIKQVGQRLPPVAQQVGPQRGTESWAAFLLFQIDSSSLGLIQLNSSEGAHHSPVCPDSLAAALKAQCPQNLCPQANQDSWSANSREVLLCLWLPATASVLQYKNHWPWSQAALGPNPGSFYFQLRNLVEVIFLNLSFCIYKLHSLLSECK